MTKQAPNCYDRQKIENTTFRVVSEYFQAQANFQTRNVTVYYYNAQPKSILVAHGILRPFVRKRVTKEYILITIIHLQLN